MTFKNSSISLIKTSLGAGGSRQEMPDYFRVIKIRCFNNYSHIGFLSLATKI